MSDSKTDTRQRTVLQRLADSGIAPQRALAHLKRGWVHVDGVTVTDPESLAEPPAQVEMRPRPPYDS